MFLQALLLQAQHVVGDGVTVWFTDAEVTVWFTDAEEVGKIVDNIRVLDGDRWTAAVVGDDNATVFDPEGVGVIVIDGTGVFDGEGSIIDTEDEMGRDVCESTEFDVSAVDDLTTSDDVVGLGEIDADGVTYPETRITNHIQITW